MVSEAEVVHEAQGQIANGRAMELGEPSQSGAELGKMDGVVGKQQSPGGG